MNAAEHLLGADALARHGARAALVCGEASLTYAELAAQVRRNAHALAGLGVAPGDRVLLLLRDTPEFAAAWLGAVRAGAVAIGLNSKLSLDDYRHIVADSGARLLVIEDVFVPALAGLVAELARGARVAVAGAHPPAGVAAWRELVARAAPDAAAYDARPTEPAFWLYSSGTTGRPKGIVHAHKDVLPAGQVLREGLGLAAGDKVFATSKLFFAYALETGLLGPLALGATALLQPDWADVHEVQRIVARERPAAVFSVPTFYRRLLALPAEQLQAFRAVRHYVAAGERLPEQVRAQWRAVTGRELLCAYGMSETFCVIMLTPPGTSSGAHTGRPLSGIDTRLLTAEGGEARPGEPGVLWLRHPALSSGYVNLPRANSEHFRDGWFCSNDIFARDADGCYAHRGRSDELVKVAGQWVQPSELEEAVLGDAAIADAACVPVIDADGFERLALFVAPQENEAQAASAATRACEQKLPRHKRPKWVRAVAELPRTASGKVQRFKLREMLERELAPKE